MSKKTAKRIFGGVLLLLLFAPICLAFDVKGFFLALAYVLIAFAKSGAVKEILYILAGMIVVVVWGVMMLYGLLLLLFSEEWND